MMEYSVTVDGVVYSENDIVSATIKRPLFDDISIGNACEGLLTLTLYPTQEVGRMAQIKVEASEDSGDWAQIGILDNMLFWKEDVTYQFLEPYDSKEKLMKEYE